MSGYGLRALMLAISFIAIANAMYLNVTGPVAGTLTNNQGLFLGNIGPGQSFYVSASATTTNESGLLVNIGWDRMEAINLPQGWSAQPSPLYENPMKIKITVAPHAAYGIYNITIKAINIQNYSKLGNITVNAYVNVTPNVFRLSVNPTNISSGINEPTNLYVTINNTGISDDPFDINLYGLPAWNLSDQVVALHSTSSSYVYPVFVSTPGTYQFNLTVSSTTNPLISRSYLISLVAQPNLLNDYSAVGQGVVLSPIVFGPSYEFMLLLSYLYKSLIH
jgi:hypothetical protein